MVAIFVDVAAAFDNLTFNALHYLLCQVRKKDAYTDILDTIQNLLEAH